MTPEEVVKGFFEAWEHEGLIVGYERYIHPNILYKNTGMEDRTDKNVIIDSIKSYVEVGKMPYARVEILTFMSSGNVVIAERIDHMFSKDSSKGHSLPAMGTFIIEDDMIKEYRDYFDPREVLATFEGKY